jgi:hypothetical protein
MVNIAKVNQILSIPFQHHLNLIFIKFIDVSLCVNLPLSSFRYGTCVFICYVLYPLTEIGSFKCINIKSKTEYFLKSLLCVLNEIFKTYKINRDNLVICYLSPVGNILFIPHIIDFFEKPLPVFLKLACKLI